MIIEELRIACKRAIETMDNELAHIECDRLLLEFINDAELASIYDEAPFWHA